MFALRTAIAINGYDAPNAATPKAKVLLNIYYENQKTACFIKKQAVFVVHRHCVSVLFVYRDGHTVSVYRAFAQSL
jgi:hypothetical protein